MQIENPGISHFAGNVDSLVCEICDKEGHTETDGPVKGTKIVQYFMCQKFVEMTPHQRFAVLREKGLCFQCLLPGAKTTVPGKHKDGNCQRNYVCKHSSHDRFNRKKHVLVCHEHRETEENAKVLSE